MLNFSPIALVAVACVVLALLLPAHPLLLGATRSSVSTTPISSTKIVGSLIASGLPRTPTVAVKRKTVILLALNLALRLPFAWK